MIPTIGVMVGFYIITRMISLGTRKGDRAEGTLVRIFAIITILVTVVSMFALMSSSSDVSNTLSP